MKVDLSGYKNISENKQTQKLGSWKSIVTWFVIIGFYKKLSSLIPVQRAKHVINFSVTFHETYNYLTSAEACPSLGQIQYNAEGQHLCLPIAGKLVREIGLLTVTSVYLWDFQQCRKIVHISVCLRSLCTTFPHILQMGTRNVLYNNTKLIKCNE